MSFRLARQRRALLATVAAAAAFISMPVLGFAQAGGSQAPQAKKTARDAAPVDFTGYWVSLITEDWRWRMLIPPKGNYASVPINAEGRKVADAWDPAKDEASGNQCKAYGAAAIMRVPGRVHIIWDNENSLRIDTDAGTQTRLLHFAGSAAPNEPATLQGYSTAHWESAPGDSLKVVTTHLRPGYLRKNGVPYSANTIMTEYYTRITGPNGSPWLLVTTVVDDPQYLDTPFVTSTHFRKLPDSSGWNPTACLVK
jgi:hypothetical protein